MIKTALLLLIVIQCAGGQEALPHRLAAIPLQRVHIHDAFWTPKLTTWQQVTIPDCFTKFENDRGGAFNNFDRVRDGKMGEHAGPEWYDGLIYEMITGSADFLVQDPDPFLEKRLDGYIDRIAAAAATSPDGYLNTWTQLMAPTHRWGLNGGNDIIQHDLYNAGALVEAGVHYYRATGKIRLLQTAVKMANLMCDVMGPAPRLNVVPGHSLGEEALVNLFLLFRQHPELKPQMHVSVDEGRYLHLAEFWIDNRGNHAGRADFGAYAQDHVPIKDQDTIEGHAVRASLLCSGIAAASVAADRLDYLEDASRLWNNMVNRRMYITGGLGAVAGQESFGQDYDLPNTGYLETCAAVGAGFFHRNMNLATGEARYADELERVLYNGALCGVSLRGNSYFYENPLEGGKNRQRWSWHGCPCCPPMFLKLMGALPGMIYTQDAADLYVNLYIGSTLNTVLGAETVRLEQQGGYPWDGHVHLIVTPQRTSRFGIALRSPDWCRNPVLKINGTPATDVVHTRGYLLVDRIWKSGDSIDLEMPMPVEAVSANANVKADAGRIAIQRGPVVYCLEGLDNNGGHVKNLVASPATRFTTNFKPGLLGGVEIVEFAGLALGRTTAAGPLYGTQSQQPGITPAHITAIPYFANANRAPNEMQVWLPQSAGLAEALPPITIASEARASASHCWQNDTTVALNDQVEPRSSDDSDISRFTWWDHLGTKEWVQYDLSKPTKVGSVEVYWWDERRIKAHCRVPQSWRLLYESNGVWVPVQVLQGSGYDMDMDRYNRVNFKPIVTKKIRIEAQLQKGWSAGILQWKVK